MVDADETSVDVFDTAPTTFPATQVGNGEIPALILIPPLLFHVVRVKAVSRLDLTKDDVTLFDVLLTVFDWCVGAFVVGMDFGVQRPTRASILNGLAFEEGFLDHCVPKVPEPQFFLPIFGA